MPSINRQNNVQIDNIETDKEKSIAAILLKLKLQKGIKNGENKRRGSLKESIVGS